MDIINETEEEIVIPPGESLRVNGETKRRKSTASRREVLKVKRVGSNPMDAVTRVECENCGDMVPSDVMDMGGHECN